MATYITNQVIALSTITFDRLSQGAPVWSTTGGITASRFVGDGSALTNLPVTSTTVISSTTITVLSANNTFTNNLTSNTINTVVLSANNTFTNNLTSNTFVTNFATVSTLQVSGIASFTTTTEQSRTVTIASSAASLDLRSAAIFNITLNSNVSASFVNPPPAPQACSFTVVMSADGTARAVTWPTTVRWAAGTPPTITSTAGKADIFSFLTTNGGSIYYGFTSDQNF